MKPPRDIIGAMSEDYHPVEILDHTADMGIMARGGDLNSLFRNAALGMSRLMVEGPLEDNGPSLAVSLEGLDLTDLFIKWLGEILYFLQGEYLITRVALVESVSPERLDAGLDLVRFDAGRHRMTLDIKAVTYHQSMVWNDGRYWFGRAIFDV